MQERHQPTDQMPLILPGLAKDTAKRIALEDFRSDVSEKCGVHFIEPVSTETDFITGDISCIPMPTVTTSVVSLDASSVARHKKIISADPGEYLFLLIQDQGHCLVQQNGASQLAAKGDMFLVDSTQPHQFSYGGAFSRQVSIHIPRSDAVLRYGQASEGGLAIERSDPLRLAIWAVLEKISQSQTDVSPELMEAFHNLLGAYMYGVSTQMDADRQRENSVIARALTLIERLSDDPAFSPTELAALLGLSPRTLQRHFRRIDETARQRILAVRLRKARARLERLDRQAGAANITSVAYDSGFSDLSYFYRSFNDHFGQRPSNFVQVV